MYNTKLTLLNEFSILTYNCIILYCYENQMKCCIIVGLVWSKRPKLGQLFLHLMTSCFPNTCNLQNLQIFIGLFNLKRIQSSSINKDKCPTQAHSHIFALKQWKQYISSRRILLPIPYQVFVKSPETGSINRGDKIPRNSHVFEMSNGNSLDLWIICVLYDHWHAINDIRWWPSPILGRAAPLAAIIIESPCHLSPLVGSLGLAWVTIPFPHSSAKLVWPIGELGKIAPK